MICAPEVTRSRALSSPWSMLPAMKPNSTSLPTMMSQTLPMRE
jgi:hypothetical protein